MTKMAAMPIYGKRFKSSPEPDFNNLEFVDFAFQYILSVTLTSSNIKVMMEQVTLELHYSFAL